MELLLISSKDPEAERWNWDIDEVDGIALSVPEGAEEDARSEVRHGVRQLLRRRGKRKRVPLQPDGDLPDAEAGGDRPAGQEHIRLCDGG